jgi:hypothetical protein
MKTETCGRMGGSGTAWKLPYSESWLDAPDKIVVLAKAGIEPEALWRGISSLRGFVKGCKKGGVFERNAAKGSTSPHCPLCQLPKTVCVCLCLWVCSNLYFFRLLFLSSLSLLSLSLSLFSLSVFSLSLALCVCVCVTVSVCVCV